MINELYLCGTMHLDLNGPARLAKILKSIAPEVVAIESYPEISKEVFEKRKEFESKDKYILLDQILTNIENKYQLSTGRVKRDSAIALLNCIGYEIWLPLEYSNKTNAKIIYLENKENAENINKKLSLDDLINDSQKINLFIDMVQLTYKTLNKLLDRCYKLCQEFGSNNESIEVTARNKIFAEKISALNGKILSITGISHVYGDEPTLQTLLKHYNPKTFSLNSIN